MVAIKTPVVLLLPGEKRDADHAGQPWKTVCLYRTVTRRRCGSALGLPLLLLLLLADGTTCLDWGGGEREILLPELCPLSAWLATKGSIPHTAEILSFAVFGCVCRLSLNDYAHT